MNKIRNKLIQVYQFCLRRRRILTPIALAVIMIISATTTVIYGSREVPQVIVDSTHQTDQLALAPTPETSPSQEPTTSPSKRPVTTATPTATPNATTAPETVVSTPRPTPRPTASATPIPTPTVTPTPTPTATPNPDVPNPPIVEIVYPTELLTIEIVTQETEVCLREEVRGGDATGLQRKHNFNSAGWTEYEPADTLCLDSRAGINSISVKYSNEAGDESPSSTRLYIVIF